MSMTILCRTCGTAATDGTHKGNRVKQCPVCENIKFRRLEVTQP